tara:strand:- start:1225 stop:1590 length:366 start_codon:yes stop_codon:yes gene_type:complete
MPQDIQKLNNRVQFLEDIILKMVKSDRFVFDRDIEMGNGRAFIFGQGQNPTDGVKIGRTANERIGFYGADGTTQQSAPTYVGLITISGTGDDANINTNFSRLESWIDDVIGVGNTIGITTS